MIKDLQIFEQNGWKIRTFLDDDSNKLLFVGSDIAEALGYKRPNDAVAQHCRHKTTTAKHSGGFICMIPESDVYRLIIKSKLPKAEMFESWVMEEVLPSIRKTGSYSIEKQTPSYQIDDPIKRAEAWIEERRMLQLAEKTLEEQKPQVQFAKTIEGSEIAFSHYSEENVF